MINIDETYKWLNIFEPSSLSLPAAILRDQILNDIRDKKYMPAYQAIEQLKSYESSRILTRERAEIWIECGLGFFYIGDPDEAMEALKRAIALDASMHAEAVAHCMLSAIQWQFVSKRSEALLNWKTAIEKLGQLADLADKENWTDRRDWYRLKIKDLEDDEKRELSKAFS